MRCAECGYENEYGAIFCAQCGGKLPVRKSSAQLAKELRLRSIILFTAAAALLFCAAAIVLFLLGGGNDDLSAHAASTEHAVPNASPTPTAEPTPSPSPTLQPFVKPTPPPTPTPTIEPFVKPTPPPTAEPTDTPYVPAVADVSDLVPIDALCAYITEGGTENIRLALPPEYIEYTISSYSFASQFLGSDDAVLDYVGKLLLAGIKAKYGNVDSIDYTLVSRRDLTSSELEALYPDLRAFGMTTMPEKARLLVLDMTIVSSKGTFNEKLSPYVLYIDGSWYLDPADLDI